MANHGLTSKGAATRQRILTAAADLVLARGVGGTSLDEIGACTGTGKSQLFHYFPGGKPELVAAIADFQGGRVLDAQRPHIDHLDTWASWDLWRAAVLDHYRSRPQPACPISALANGFLGQDPDRAAAMAQYMRDWQRLLELGVLRMIANGHVRSDTDARHTAAMIFAALQGGLGLMHGRHELGPLEAGLDAALVVLRSTADEREPVR